MKEDRSWIETDSADDKQTFTVFEWSLVLQNDYQRYMKLRRRKPQGLLMFLMMCAVFVLAVSTMIVSLSVTTTHFMIALFTGVPTVRWIRRNKHGLTSVVLTLTRGELKFSEQYGPPGWGRNMEIASVKATRIKGAQWVSEGLLIEKDWLNISPVRFIVPINVFMGESEVKLMEKWAALYGIEIEGVPPLGVYQRPIEGDHRL